MDQETRLILDEFTIFEKDLELAFNTTLPNPKDPQISELVRKKGNDLFSKKIHSQELHKDILSRYNASAAFAPSASQELASAYANRSAFLLHIEKYDECIQDIQKALEITDSHELKIKLLCRKVKCLKKLGTTCENTLDEAQGLVDKIDKDDDKKQKLSKMVTKAASLLIAEKGDVSQKTNELVNMPVTDDLLERVSIEYNEKYGRHLVAKQNYNPGDIIFVEKLFLKSVDFDLRYTNCHHCLKDCWTGVPCHFCDWVMFCSEECRDEAWTEYHDIECSIGPLLNDVLEASWDACSLSIKIFIKAMKDAGSIENLRAQLEAVDQCTDLCYKGFYKDGKFTSRTIESLYSLTKKNNLEPKEISAITRITLVTLIGLLKHPALKDIFSVEKLEDMIQNEDILFLGSLLMTLIKIEFNNSFTFVNFASVLDAERGMLEAPRGTCIGSLTCLINNSCCPNVHISFREDGKAIICAVQPVEENCQIFIAYSKEYYFDYPKERHFFLKKYGFECDCQACTESWPALLIEMVTVERRIASMKTGAEANFVKQSRDVMDAIVSENYSKATLEKLRDKINLSFMCLEQPSIITCVMLHALHACFQRVYDCLKSQTFGRCSKMLRCTHRYTPVFNQEAFQFQREKLPTKMYEIVSAFFGRSGILHGSLLFMLKLCWNSSSFMASLGFIGGLSYWFISRAVRIEITIER